MRNIFSKLKSIISKEHSHKLFINPDGKLFYEDQYSLALIDGLSKKQLVVKFSSKYITIKNDKAEIK